MTESSFAYDGMRDKQNYLAIKHLHKGKTW